MGKGARTAGNRKRALAPRRTFRSTGPAEGSNLDALMQTTKDAKTMEVFTAVRQADKKKALYQKLLKSKKDAKRTRREAREADRKKNGTVKLVPKTKENTRRPDITIVEDAADKEVRRDEQEDEFATFYKQVRPAVSDSDNDGAEGAAEAEAAVAPALPKHLSGKKRRAEARLAKQRERKQKRELAGAAGDDDDDNGASEAAAAAAAASSKAPEVDKTPGKVRNPKILITTCRKASYRTRMFVKEALWLFPNSTFRPRQDYSLKEIIEFCKNRGFTDVICIGERIKQPFEMIVTHLPDGPTATFRISNFLPAKEIENVAERTEHYPELNLKNFDTRLGRRVARQLEALFPATRDYAGRAIATFHNQRDFIFLRTHRYIFDGLDEVRIQELGPRFTLRLMSLQKGTFDSKFGEFEWIRKKIHDTDKHEWYL